MQMIEQKHPNRIATAVNDMPARRILVLGADGQLGEALREEYVDTLNIDFANRRWVDITSDLESRIDWQLYDTVINAAAYTSVDQAETDPGRTAAWMVNTEAVTRLAKIASNHKITVVHVSTDYVFDGRKDSAYFETDHLSPLN